MRNRYHKVKKETEAFFFDRLAGNYNPDMNVTEIFYKHSREGKFFFESLPKDFSGKKILDVGCGNGKAAVFFAKRGGQVEGIDISKNSVSFAKLLVAKHKVSNLVKIKVGDIHRLDFADNCFDVVFARAVLHHSQLEVAVKEIYRVLKPGGIALFSDPLNYNPLFKIYDHFTISCLDSPDERRLNTCDLSTIKKYFPQMKWIGTDITSLVVFGLYLLYQKIAKHNVSSVWFEDIELGRKWSKLYALCNKMDSFLPSFLQLFGWRIVMACKKDGSKKSIKNMS